MLKNLLALAMIFALVSCATTNTTENQVTDDVVVSETETLATNNNIALTETGETTNSSSGSLPYGAYLEFPQNPSEGQCFAKVTVPEKYTFKTERVMVRPERKVIDTTPARYGVKTQEIVVKEATTRLRAIPATYKKMTERVQVTPERVVLKTHPPVYKTVTERVLVRPERKVWKVGREWKAGSLATKYGNSGEIRCLVKVPAEYQTITKRVVAQPARTERVVVPAVFKTITKTVVDQAATTQEVPVPAVKKFVKVKEMVEGPRSVERTIPATYKTVKRKVVTQEPYEMWSGILCRTNDSTAMVRSLQTKLRQLGYTNVDVDGVIGPSTHRAVRSYQTRVLGKPYYNGRITLDTLKSLELL